MSSEDAALSSRAAAVMPWRDGLYGHMSTALLPAGYPQFCERGQGGRVWDVNGNSYIDLMCSWGTIVLGHHHTAVEAAVANQQALGDCLNGPGRPMVELAELLTETIGHADWAMFAKNGTDATTICTMVARAATGRRYILWLVAPITAAHRGARLGSTAPSPRTAAGSSVTTSTTSRPCRPPSTAAAAMSPES